MPSTIQPFVAQPADHVDRDVRALRDRWAPSDGRSNIASREPLFLASQNANRIVRRVFKPDAANASIVSRAQTSPLALSSAPLWICAVGPKLLEFCAVTDMIVVCPDDDDFFFDVRIVARQHHQNVSAIVVERLSVISPSSPAGVSP